VLHQPAIDAKGFRMAKFKHHGVSVEHAMPGRLRIKYRPLKKDPSLAHGIHQELSSVDGVTHVDMQPVIGGVTIKYDKSAASIEFFMKVAAALGLAAADIDPEEISEVMKLVSELEKETGATFADVFESLGKTIEAGVKTLTEQGVRFEILMPLVLATLGVRSLIMSEQLRAPSWYEYFWFSFGTYYTLNKPESPGEAAT
jgi:hypothetical protein